MLHSVLTSFGQEFSKKSQKTRKNREGLFTFQQRTADLPSIWRFFLNKFPLKASNSKTCLDTLYLHKLKRFGHKRKKRLNGFYHFRSQCSPGSQPQYLGSGLAHLLRPQGPFQSLARGASAQWIWCDSVTRSLVPAGSWTSEIRHSTFYLFRHFQFRLLGLFAAFGLFRTHHTQ